MVSGDNDDATDEVRKRWKTDESGNLISYLLKGFETAQVADKRCAVRLDFLTAQDQSASLQLSIDPIDARRLAGELDTLSHYVLGTDPRPQALHGSINAVTNPAHYPRAGRCIYCGAHRYSDDREHLGDEHIIPLALNGDLVLPDAACGICEGKLNSYEQYCHKLTFGPLRYHLGLATRRPKERPGTLPLECTIAGQKVMRDVPIDSMPMGLFLPLFDLPDILLDKDPVERNIYTTKFVMRQLPPYRGDWLTENKVTSVRSYETGVEGIKFALLIAKIGHAYATAECINDPDYHPVLAELVRKETSPLPLPYLVGGEQEILPATDNLHEVQILRRRTAKQILLVVRIRLFAFLATPTYYAVAGAYPIQPTGPKSASSLSAR
jgi:hypothetical protein